MSLDTQQLLKVLTSDRAVSGSELARRFGVTRAAIWKQIEVLRSLGVPVEAKAGDGYRLGAALDLLDPSTILASMPEYARSRVGALDLHWQIDSTNSELMRQAEGPDFAVCIAELQTSGRGRRGRNWHMPLTGGLALSLRKRFDSSMTALAGLSLVAGIALARALEDCGFDGIGLKWPNDVQVDRRKLAGILVELGGDALGPCHAVIGIGINLRLDNEIAQHIDQPWIDLAGLAKDALPTRNRLAARLLVRLIEALDQFTESGFPSFADVFAQYDVLRGQQVRISIANRHRDGMAIGIDAGGALRVRADDGEFSVDSGEVSVRARAENGA